jgi:hypothetical protein
MSCLEQTMSASSAIPAAKTSGDYTMDTDTMPAPASVAWHEKINPDTMTAKQFAELVANFVEWGKQQADEPIDLPDGWCTITPALAEKLLIRNAANRKPTFGHVAYLMGQMKSGDWPETGQTTVMSPSKRLEDGQHRAWSGLLSNTAYSTYIVNLRTEVPNLFCYIDNGKSRSAKDALETAGQNGLSPMIASTVVMSMHVDANAYKVDSVQRLPKVTPLKMLRYVTDHPDLRKAVRLMVGEYSGALDIIGHKDVGGFAAYKIMTLHDEFALGEFMGELAAVNEQFDPGSPIAALQAVLRADQVSDEPMKKHQVLGHVIKGFNAWVAGEQVKKIGLRVNEHYPSFVAKEVEAEASAAAAE